MRKAIPVPPPPKKRRGRPKGSTNKTSKAGTVPVKSAGIATEEQIKDFMAGVDKSELTLGDAKLYYQVLAEEQKYLATKVRNLRANGELVRSSDVEMIIVGAFKAVAHYLDNLPDIMERDGFIRSDQVTALIEKTDEMRGDLSIALRKIANVS